MITVCIPTLNRYDMLEKLILSAEAGGIKPDKYLIVDNGGKLDFALNTKVDLYIPPRNIGVAASWNWLIKNSSEIRFICNDDVEFLPDTLETVVKYFTEKCILFHTRFNRHNNDYSGFVISDYVFNLVGDFDESISPNYGYFEDNDYERRCEFHNVKIERSFIPVAHDNSSTLKAGYQRENDLSFSANAEYMDYKIKTQDFTEGKWSIKRRRKFGWD